MGMNYFVKVGSKELHIGKSSIGWQFLFEGHKGYDLDSKNEWLHFLSKYRKNIYDSEEQLITFNELREIIERKSARDLTLKNHYDECLKSDKLENHTIKDDEGYTIIFNEFR